MRIQKKQAGFDKIIRPAHLIGPGIYIIAWLSNYGKSVELLKMMMTGTI